MTIDKLVFENSYLDLDEEFYDLTEPTPLDNPYFISLNPKMAEKIGLDSSSAKDPLFVELLNGTFVPKTSKPYAMCYAGHQFGSYAQRLGDGRAINLGSINGWNVQTKGSGETLYSR